MLPDDVTDFIDKISCLRYNTVAHFGPDAGSVAAAAACDAFWGSDGSSGGGGCRVPNDT